MFPNIYFIENFRPNSLFYVFINRRSPINVNIKKELT